MIVFEERSIKWQGRKRKHDREKKIKNLKKRRKEVKEDVMTDYLHPRPCQSCRSF